MSQTSTHQFHTAEDLRTACAYLDNDDPIVIPTDTVYGIAAKYDSSSAIRKIYAIKERPLSKAIPVLLGNVAQLNQVALSPAELRASGTPMEAVNNDSGDKSRAAAERDNAAYVDLLAAFTQRWWPGPLTVILQARGDLPTVLTAGASTIAVRIPDHGLLRELIQTVGPLAATSANLSGAPEAKSATAALEQLNGRVPSIFDGGPAVGGVASTIVDLSDMAQLTALSGGSTAATDKIILRPGPIGQEIRTLIVDLFSKRLQ